ncbi:MAG: ATPase [Tissierellia bacterium]|nr:ATPase [Tissierellia bacterium]
MDILKLLDDMEEIVETASTIPFSGKTVINKEELLEIVQTLRVGLPDEIKQAAWIKEERDRIIKEAEAEAHEKISLAQQKAAELIDESELMQEATNQAEKLINNAQAESKQIREGARDYADQILQNTQENLSEVIKLLNENRQELRD